MSTETEKRVTGRASTGSSRVSALASWKAPSPSIAVATSPLTTKTREPSVSAAAIAVIMLPRPGPPMHERRAEIAARPRIAVGHVGRTALLGGDDGLQLREVGERRKERDRPARPAP